MGFGTRWLAVGSPQTFGHSVFSNLIICMSLFNLKQLKNTFVFPFPEPCPKCEHPRAFFMQIQTRSADEPMTTFYKCCSLQCGHRWRDWERVHVCFTFLCVCVSCFWFELISSLVEVGVYWSKMNTRTSRVTGQGWGFSEHRTHSWMQMYRSVKAAVLRIRTRNWNIFIICWSYYL